MPNFINATEEANDSSLDAEAPTSHQDVFSSSHPCHAWVFEECESICRLYGSIHQTRGTQNYRRQEIRRLAIRSGAQGFLPPEESINRDLYKCFVIIEEKWEQHPVRLLYEKTYFFT